MKRLLGVFCMAFILCVSAAVVSAAPIRLAVLRFDSITQQAQKDNIGRIVSERMISAAVKSGFFQVVERHMIDQVFSEMEFGETELSGTNAQKLGFMLNAEYVLLGSVSQLGGELNIEARLVQVSNGSIILAENGYSRASLSQITEAASGVMDRIVRLLRKDDSGEDDLQQVNAFLNKLFVLYLRNDMDVLRQYYADPVAFYGQGNWPLDKVIKEKKRYVKRWPRREGQIYNLRVSPQGNGTYLVTYEMRWKVSSPARKKTRSGTLEARLRLKKEGGSIKVVGESSKVLSRD